MLDAIAAAREQILLEMYWFDSDATGRRFAAALSDAARRGVEVAVVYDAVGSREADPAMFAELAETGVQVLEYNPLAPWKQRFRLDRLTQRDHRKLLVVDGTVGFTGGINLADPWAPVSDGGAGWRDEMVCVQGPAVRTFSDAFRQTWRRQGGPSLARAPVGPDDAPTEQLVSVLTESARRRAILRAYVHNIYRARRRIWIANSYFVPAPAVLRALRYAARHGLDVRVIVPGRSDVEITRYASRAIWAGLMRRGVRIYEWQGSMLHSKTAVIDGMWSTIGTFNLDYLSLRSNLEINVAVHDPDFGARVEAAFEADFACSHEVDPTTFGIRSVTDRLVEKLGYQLRKML